jgi:hypothetical protein
MYHLICKIINVVIVADEGSPSHALVIPILNLKANDVYLFSITRQKWI